MSDFIAALDLEIRNLEKAVEAIPDVVKLRELQRIRALYTSETVARVVGPLIAKYAASPPGRKMSVDRQQALDFVSKHLRMAISPVKTAILSEQLVNNGINVGGADPVNSLSALLSTSGKFVAHGRSGWTLKPSDDGNQVSAPGMAGNGNPGSGEPGKF